jgi:class 3 adenylate cyclase/predicted ATPase
VSFLEIIESAKAFLERNRRVSLRALQREFELDDEALEELVGELTDVQRVAAREGRVLAWIEPGAAETAPPEPVTPAASESAEAMAAAAERRQLTVMFCDLVDSTELSERLDAEELREIVRAYQETAAETIERYAGHVAQYLGDGLLVYFGYPRAHEDDAVRGVTASLGILDALPGLNARLRERYPRLGDAALEVRIGVHTGPVVIGEMGGGGTREWLALGDTVNLAARLQGVAAPGQVVMTEATGALVRGVFVTEHLGERTLKGIETPVAVQRVVRPTGVQSRLELAAATGLTPLVGREQELALLLDRWEQVCEGHGQGVLLHGDAGIGKSRLVRILRERLADEAYSWLEARGSAYHQSSALHPVIELLEQVLRLGPEDSAEEKIARLEAALEQAGFSLPEVLPLFATLLSIPLPEGYPPLQLSPQAQRLRTLESLVAWLFRLSEAQRLVLVVEDLHWIDPSTLEFLGMLLEQVPTVPVLVLLTFRPEFEPPWASHTHLALHPLTRKQVETMVERIAGGKALPALVLEQVVAKTDGVPLFVEEFTKTLLESDLLRESDRSYERTDPLPEHAIPNTLRDSLMARLDRLGAAKEVAQLGAVLGREFSYELIAAVSSLEAESLEQALRDLASAELLYPRGVPPRATYTFKHALVQDTAYESLLKSVRERLHAQVAKTLETRFPGQAESQPELLGHHYGQAGLAERAVHYWHLAGQRCVARSANVEAIQHLRRGLEALGTLPESPERVQRELELLTPLGVALIATEGYATEGIERHVARSRELCAQLGDTPELIPVLWGLWAVHLNRADREATCTLAEQVSQVASRSTEAEHRLLAHHAMGLTAFYRGAHEEAREQLNRLLEIYDFERHSPMAFTTGADLGVYAHLYMGLNEWLTGYPDRSMESLRQAVALAERVSHPFTLAMALSGEAASWMRVRDIPRAEESADRLIALSREQGFPQWLGIGEGVQGWTRAMRGKQAEGSGQIEEGISITRMANTRLNLPSFLCNLAEAFLQSGAVDPGLQATAAALALAQTTVDRYFEAEIHRLRGELLLRAEDSAGAAEESFRRALDVARPQGARSLELRAATSLARVWQSQGKKDDARALLAPVYGWFTEGFHTQDLKDAKALLDELT